MKINHRKVAINTLDLCKDNSDCLRRQVGAVIYKKGKILSTGFNASPNGVTSCEITGCLREKLNVPSGERHELCKAIHAEQMALTNALKNNVDVSKSIMYVTHKPCSICAKLIVNSGIKEVQYIEDYEDSLTDIIFKGSNVIIKRIGDE